ALRRYARPLFLFRSRPAPAVVADELRDRLTPAHRPGWTRVFPRGRAADHHDLARGQIVRYAEDPLGLGVLRRATEPGGAAAIPEHGRARQQSLGQATFVVRAEHRFRAVKHDRDPDRRTGEPVDVRAQGCDLLQAFLVAH